MASSVSLHFSSNSLSRTWGTEPGTSWLASSLTSYSALATFGGRIGIADVDVVVGLGLGRVVLGLGHVLLHLGLASSSCSKSWSSSTCSPSLTGISWITPASWAGRSACSASATTQCGTLATRRATCVWRAAGRAEASATADRDSKLRRPTATTETRCDW